MSTVIRTRFLIIAALVLCSLGGIALYLDQHFTPQAAAATKQVSSGAIYSVVLNDSEGKRQSLGQWQNKLLIINFWATWCAPCKEEMPELMELQRKFGANGMQIVGIAADNQLNVAKFGKLLKVNYPLLVDEMGALDFSKRLGNRLGLLPHTVIVQPGGKVLLSKLGKINMKELDTIIQQNLPKNH